MQFKKSFVLYIETIVTTLEPECAMAYNVDVELSSSIELEEAKNDFVVMVQSSEMPTPRNPSLIHPPAPKKRKVTTQDIQNLQMEVLALEKTKIEMEVENLRLANEKMKLEINELRTRYQPLDNN